MTQTVKNLAVMQETWVRSLGWEDLLEEGMITYSSILHWRIPMDKGAWRARVCGAAKSQIRLSDELKNILKTPEGTEGCLKMNV